MGRHAGTQFFYAMTPPTLPQDSPFGRGIHAVVNVALKSLIFMNNSSPSSFSHGITRDEMKRDAKEGECEKILNPHYNPSTQIQSLQNNFPQYKTLFMIL